MIPAILTMHAIMNGAALAVILLTLGVSLGIWGIGFVVSVIQRTLATANSGSGSTRRSTGFGRHG